MLLRCAVAPGFPVAQDPGLSRSARPAHEASARSANRPPHCRARANAAPAADLLIEAEHGILGRDILNDVTVLLDGPRQQWSEPSA